LTYDQLIEKVRNRGYKWLYGTSSYDKGVIYDFINEEVDNLALLTKDYQKSSTLSIIAGQSDYTVSSAIASDVGSILLITTTGYEIHPCSLTEFKRRSIQTYDEQSQLVERSEPSIYTVWNGVLSLFPVPSQAVTANVYYTPEIPSNSYTTILGSTDIALVDVHLHALIYMTLAALAEKEGKFDQAKYYSQRADEELETSMSIRDHDDNSSSITYHPL
jgi:hypothetical protein